MNAESMKALEKLSLVRPCSFWPLTNRLVSILNGRFSPREAKR